MSLIRLPFPTDATFIFVGPRDYSVQNHGAKQCILCLNPRWSGGQYGYFRQTITQFGQVHICKKSDLFICSLCKNGPRMKWEVPDVWGYIAL